MWTTHASSWDYDTDIKFVLYGPGFIKEGVKLDKTTLQNIAPTYAHLIGTSPPQGVDGTRDGGGARSGVEAASGHPHDP
jgi:hypothetical protein